MLVPILTFLPLLHAQEQISNVDGKENTKKAFKSNLFLVTVLLIYSNILELQNFMMGTVFVQPNISQNTSLFCFNEHKYKHAALKYV